MDLASILFLASTICLSYGDFLDDLDKMDVDSQLFEIDKMMKTMNDDEDAAMEKLKKKDDNVDDMDLGDAISALSDLIGKGECKYKCKNGKKPKPKPGHKPTSNGCGSYGLQIDVMDIPGMTSCCDKHDYCYDTCNSDREKCDKDFKQCLHNTCKDLKQKNKKGSMDYKECKTGADLMFGGAAALGCQPFLDAQEKACTCDVISGKANKKEQTKEKKGSSAKSAKSKTSDNKANTAKADQKKKRGKDEL